MSLTTQARENPAPTLATDPPGTASRSRRPRGAHWMLIVPALLLTLFGVGYPLILSLWYGVTRVEGGENGFVWLLGNPVYLDIMQRTFVTALITVVVCIAMGYPFAYLITVSSPRTRAILLAVAIVPFWISGLVRVFAWLVILQPNGFCVVLRSQTGVLIGLAQVLLPFMILPLYSVMRTIDLNLMLAAESLGARRSTAFFRVFVPLSLPGLFAGSLVVLVLTLGFYVLPQILGSPQQALIGQVIYTQASTLSNIGRAGALSVTLLVITLALIAAGIVVRRAVTKEQVA